MLRGGGLSGLLFQWLQLWRDCMAVAVSGDMEDCTCRNDISFPQFEREEYNKTVKALRQEIKDLESENACLNRIIRKLTRHKEK